MTPQEALDWCEQFTDNLVKANVDTKRRTLGLQAMQTIKSALEKQIPKKPRVMKVHDISGYKYGDCHCGEHIMDDEKYCSNCGQALDWGEDSE